ncbi:extensin [Candidatus Bathyarchaeota archaeon]|nr:MAG: extensin [Candidatus Bathyarchaeota archaeon]
MRIDELPIPEDAKKLFLEEGIRDLYPPQEEAFRKTRVLEGGNLLMASPTASGKTLVAEVCALKHIIEGGGKVVYTTPLRALASEKFTRFKRYEKLKKLDGGNVRVTISTGDYDSSDPWLSRYDWIVTTYEKLDSLLRHGAPWVKDVTLLVVDEVHYLGQGDRGPTLEVLLTRFRMLNPKGQIIALSATVRNVEELARWFNADYTTTEWRPVTLKEGIYLDGVVRFSDGTVLEVEDLGDPIVSLTYDVIKRGGQILIFTETRKKAVSVARKLSKTVEKLLDKRVKSRLKRIAGRIVSSADKTRLDEALAKLIEHGTAFHHAGLRHERRTLVEEAFRKGYVKALAATPTLAAGVNLPARRVVLASYERYEPGYGRTPISVMEYKQMIGRAGRPGLDPVGEAVLIARSEDELEFLMERYVYARPERIWSNLGAEPFLRPHVLSSIATGVAYSVEGVLDFFSKTLYAYQMGVESIAGPIRRILDFLEENGFIRVVRGMVEPTALGKRVSELYIDPLSAAIIIDGFERRRASEVSEFGLLHLVNHTPDASPKLYPRRREVDELIRVLELREDELLVEVPDRFSEPVEFEALLGEIKMTLVMMDWINEVSENTILDKYGVEPGDLYRLVSSVNWLLYAAQELSKLMGFKRLTSKINILRNRVEKGVREELLTLTSLEGIGRVRARALYQAGYRTLEDLRRASLEELMRIPTIGGRIAKRIKEQVGGTVSQEALKAAEDAGVQKTLTDYSRHRSP